MRSSRPPALATWLVEHLISRDKSEALAGDLLERFSQGRSVAWYWRQALVAIFMDFSKELRILWEAAGFTLVWVSVIAASKQKLIYFSHNRLFEAVFGWEVTRAWPVSVIAPITFIVVLTAGPLLVSLAAYLVIAKRFNLRRLFQGLSVGLVGVVLGYVGEMLILVSIGSLAGYVSLSLPFYFGLLLSMWTARPKITSRAISF